MSFSLAKQVTVDGEPSALVHVVHGVDYDDYGKAILEMSDLRFANYSLSPIPIIIFRYGWV